MSRTDDHTSLVRCDNCGRYGWHITERCPEPRQHWRDFAEHLTPETVAGFEASEHLARTEVHLAFPGQEPAEVLRRVQARLLDEARQQVPFAGVQLPAGAERADLWQDYDGAGDWSRMMFGTRREIAHLAVQIDGVQAPNGSVEWNAYAFADDDVTSPQQLRMFAAMLMDAADELERLTAR